MPVSSHALLVVLVGSVHAPMVNLSPVSSHSVLLFPVVLSEQMFVFVAPFVGSEAKVYPVFSQSVFVSWATPVSKIQSGLSNGSSL